MKLTALLILASLFTSTAFATTAPNCISKEDMTEIASDFTQFSKLSGKEFCHDGSVTANLLQSLMFMRQNQFAADMKPSSDELFTGKFASSWYKYFIGRINDMVIDDGCPKGVAAYVYGFGGNTMYVCSAALNDNYSALDRASIFMHEARHIDGYPHMTCTHGARKGLQGACDTRISAGGSYAVTVETYAQLAKYSKDLHPALKAYSRSSAVIYADEAFETKVRVDRGVQLLAMTQNRDLKGIDLKNTAQVEELGQSPALGHIVMRAQHMVLFPEDKTLPAKYLFANNVGEINQSPGDAFTEYNAQTPAQKAEFVDYHSGAQWNAKVYKTKVQYSCDPRSATVREENINNATEAVAILHLNGYDRVSRSQYLLAKNGMIFEFGCTEKLQAFLKKTTMTLDQTYKRIHKIGDAVVGLTEDGRLHVIKGNVSSPLQTAIDGDVYEIAPRQTFNFFDSI